MSDVQRAAALGFFTVLGGLALIHWGGEQDNPYTLVSEASGLAVMLGMAVLVAGAIVTVAAVIYLALGRRDFTRR